MQKSFITQICTSIATLGPIGYLPAPGTMGTVAALPLAYGLLTFSVTWQLTIIASLFCISYFIIDRALQVFTSDDPSQIILDEVIGTLVTFCCLAYSPVTFLAGFAFFRLYDITKPFGIRSLEKIPGSFGILIDDVGAGILAHLILRLIFS
jgi:phosphatidylglycerophosphatase A